jgi:hypothetical protein
MKVKDFTPNKWHQSHRPIPNDEDGMYATQIYTEDGETIATLHWYPKQKEKVIIDGKPMISTGTYRDGNARLIVEAPEMYSLLSRIIGNKSAMEHISDEWQDAVKSILERVG